MVLAADYAPGCLLRARLMLLDGESSHATTWDLANGATRTTTSALTDVAGRLTTVRTDHARGCSPRCLPAHATNGRNRAWRRYSCVHRLDVSGDGEQKAR